MTDDRHQVPATTNGAAGYLAAAVSLYCSFDDAGKVSRDGMAPEDPSAIE